MTQLACLESRARRVVTMLKPCIASIKCVQVSHPEIVHDVREGSGVGQGIASGRCIDGISRQPEATQSHEKHAW